MNGFCEIKLPDHGITLHVISSLLLKQRKKKNKPYNQCLQECLLVPCAW